MRIVLFEISLKWTDLIAHAPDGVWLDIAPLRILSFDIECAAQRGKYETFGCMLSSYMHIYK